MEVHRLDVHSSLRHHESCYRAVDASGHQDKTLSVGTERKTAKTFDLVPEDVCRLTSDVYSDRNVRVVDVYIQDLAEMVAISKKYTGYEFYPIYVLDIAKIKPVK